MRANGDSGFEIVVLSCGGLWGDLSLIFESPLCFSYHLPWLPPDRTSVYISNISHVFALAFWFPYFDYDQGKTKRKFSNLDRRDI